MASSTAQNDASTDYWPIHIARSDGQSWPSLDHNALSSSEDQDVTQLERWEVIVAGHLQNQIAPKDDSMCRHYKSVLRKLTCPRSREAIQARRLPQGLRAAMRR
jgi:hypothetical protein